MSKLNNWKPFLDFTKTGVDLGDFLNESVKKKTKGHEGILYRSLCCRTKCN